MTSRFPPVMAGVDGSPASTVREVDDLRTTVARTLPAATVDVTVRPGPPEAVLAQESGTASLIVLAAPGRLSPMTAALLRSATCPVLVARSAGPDDPGRRRAPRREGRRR